MKKFNRAFAVAVCAVATIVLAGVFSKAHARDDGIVAIYPINTDEHSFPNPDDPALSGQTVKFGVRLLNYFDSGKRIPWVLHAKNDGAYMSGFEPGFGIFVSGSLMNAKIVNVTTNTSYFTELECEYQVRGGDISLPIHLSDADKHEITGRKDKPVYYFCNSSMWSIVPEGMESSGIAARLSYVSSAINPDAAEYVDAYRKTDYSLNEAGLYVRAIDFDSNYADSSASPKIWREIHDGLTSTTTIQPMLHVPGGSNPDTTYYLYLWLEESGGNSNFSLPDAQLTYDSRAVQRVSIEPHTTNLPVRIRASSPGSTATIYMAPTPTNRYIRVGEEVTLVTNFVKRVVKCKTAPEPYIWMSIDNDYNSEKAVTATTNKSAAVAQLFVNLSAPYSEDMTVTIVPSMEDAADVFDSKIIGMSDRTLSSSWADTVTNVVIKAGETQGSVYVYALGATDSSATYGITFTPTVTNAAAAAYYSGKPGDSKIYVDDVAPLIVSPSDGAVFGASAGLEKNYTIMIDDDYRGTSGATTGYTVSWEYGDGTSSVIKNLQPVNKKLTFPVRYSSQGEWATIFYVRDERGNQSATRTINATVAAPRAIEAELYRDTGFNDKYQTGTFCEGERPIIRFKLNQSYASKLYAFLEPLNETSSNFVHSAAFTKGVLIPENNYHSTPSNFTLDFIDGSANTADLEFGIVLRAGPTLSDTVIQNLYTANTLFVAATNATPYVVNALMNDGNIENGFAAAHACADVPNVFDITFQDLGVFDKTNNLANGGFRARFRYTDGTSTHPITTYQYVSTNALRSASSSFTLSDSFTFASGGTTQTVQVAIQDKDMYEQDENLFSEPFTFKVIVDERPRVSITTDMPNNMFSETDFQNNLAYLNVKLSQIVNRDLGVQITIKNNSGEGYCELEEDFVRVPKIQPGATLRITDMDGTARTAIKGFTVTATVTNETESAIRGVAWKDYFDSGELTFYVTNAAPRILLPVNTGITNVVSKNVNIEIPWEVTDVNSDTNSLVTTFSGDSKQFKAVSGVYTNVFTSAGFHAFTMTVRDKDGGVTLRTIMYYVEPTKEVYLKPYRPAGNTNSKYGKAAGRGTGRVWANASRCTVSSFLQTWYYSSRDATAVIHAFGYPSGDPDAQIDNGKLTPKDMDVPISPGGNLLDKDLPDDSYYQYKSAYDNYFYCWVGVTPAEENSAPVITHVKPAPTYTPNVDTELPLKLPDYEEGATAYPTRHYEAIFSREWLLSDNIGDLNADGIPDVFMMEFFYSDNDETFNDLANLSTRNDDNDFLPGGAPMLSWIPGLADTWENVGTPFTAITEIRGYGQGLNNGPVLMGFDEVRTTREFSKLEQDAYDQLTDGEKAGWSPERPTDPTKDDTDGDTFPDGYEYWFWYNAKVGYMENGVHKYLHGEAYDPEHPEQGNIIMPADIYTAFDPIVRSGVSATLRDIDNDGLPDITELALGTSPINWDSDGDGLPDGYEVMLGLDPKTPYSVSKMVPDYMLQETGASNTGDHMAFELKKMQAVGIEGPDHKVTYVVSANPDVSFGKAQQVVGYVLTSWLPPYTQYYTTSMPELQEVSLSGMYTFFVLMNELPAASTWEISSFDPATGSFVLGDAADLHAGVSFFSSRPQQITADAPESGWKIYIDPVSAGLGSDGPSVFFTKINPATLTVVTTNIDTSGEIPVTNITSQSVLRSPLTLGSTWEVFAYEMDEYQGKPAYLPRGTKMVVAPEKTTWYKLAFLGNWPEYSAEGRDFAAYSAWKYGKSLITNYYGVLCMGVQTNLPPQSPVCEIIVGDDPDTDWADVAIIHYINRQYFGYDPRTAWSSTTPLAARWDGLPQGNATRTRPYYHYDEFLLMDFWFRNGAITAGSMIPTVQRPLQSIWAEYTTNPTTYNKLPPDDAQSGNYGIDSDGDGVPDGWELYTMSGDTPPDEPFNTPGPTFALSPLRALAASLRLTDGPPVFDNDDLSQFYEFIGTDTLAYYSPLVETIKAENYTWFNKFFPTDPFNPDTDGDGITDALEGDAEHFLYGTPADNGTTCIPGGGLNPCSWDTDLDGLPDPWEVQFRGKFVAVEGADAASGNPAAGITNGMDGTVWDAMTTYPPTINRDYDMDGLENCQEYLTGVMRCWRYDDPVSIWGVNHFDFMSEESLYRSFILGENPNMVDGVFDFTAAYMSRCTNEWDRAYWGYYWFYDGKYHELSAPSIQVGDNYFNSWQYAIYTNENMQAGMRGDLTNAVAWASVYAPQQYCSTSPIDKDSDGDGMDDYWEVFHGLNPLLGTPGNRTSAGSADLVFESYRHIAGVNALFNPWHGQFAAAAKARGTRNPEWDFTFYPWLAGAAQADPDGDNIRNQEEAVMAIMQSQSTWHHTDPSPLWMTDSSWTNSISRKYYLSWSREAHNNGDFKFLYNDEIYTIPGEWLASFNPLPWKINEWMFPFEENEGYDSDHDGVSDYDEVRSKFAKASDPQDNDDTRHRLAMYFPGDKSLCENRPEWNERGALEADDIRFLNFTAELWAKSEDPTNGMRQVLIERAVYTGDANASDVKYLRKNFQIGIDEEGKWYALYDSRGVDTNQFVSVTGAPATTNWTHLAATYDGEQLRLYVDGQLNAQKFSKVQPEYGVRNVLVGDNSGFEKSVYWMMTYTDVNGQSRTVPASALLVGAAAHAKSALAITAYDPEILAKYAAGETLSETNSPIMASFDNGSYGDYYKGFIDEIRVWDGARSSLQIEESYRERFNADTISNLRIALFNQWAGGARRNIGNLDPELIYHFRFDGNLGAESAENICPHPRGFTATNIDNFAYFSRPDGWTSPWWDLCLVKSTVYNDYAWIPWIDNTAWHMPRFDGTVRDSVFWSKDWAGDISAVLQGFSNYGFPMTHEVASIWNQPYATNHYANFTRRWVVAEPKGLLEQYLFTMRLARTDGMDILPLGGAYVKYIDHMWDEKGPSSVLPVNGKDSDGDGLPDWFEAVLGGDFAWDDIVTFNGQSMTAGQAYARAVADGATQTNPNGDPALAQHSIDEDENGLPDWWENVYQLEGNARDDNDSDQLSNYAEFLVAEMFGDYGFPLLSPVNMHSLHQKVPDYFLKVGKLYLGEMFADHDFIEDWWEDKYNSSYTTRFLYDANRDDDQDGWSNYAEARYSMQVRPINADGSHHFDLSGAKVDDYPKPTITVDLRYYGDIAPATVSKYSVVIETSRSPVFEKGAEAKWVVTPKEEPDEGVRELGKWTARHALGTLSPGSVSASSIKLEAKAYPDSTICMWSISVDGTSKTFSGTYDDYIDSVLAYGEKRVKLISPSSDYAELKDITVIANEETQIAHIMLKTTIELGKVDLKSGQYDIDLSILEPFQIVDETASQEASETTDGQNAAQTQVAYLAKLAAYRLKYASFGAIGMPRKVYLGDPASGTVYEGVNYFRAFIDVNGDGAWNPGEPFGTGLGGGSQVGWFSGEVQIAMTDYHPGVVRMNIADALSGSADYATMNSSSDRGVIGLHKGYGKNKANDTSWTLKNTNTDEVVRGNPSPSEISLFQIVRTHIGTQSYVTVYNTSTRRFITNYVYGVVSEMEFAPNKHTVFSEQDIEATGFYDLDWGTLTACWDRLFPAQTGVYTMLTNASYTILVNDAGANQFTTNNIIPLRWQNVFEPLRTHCMPIEPSGSIVLDGMPKFRWKHEQNVKDYPAFELRVYNGSTLVYDSGVQKAPARSEEGVYEWTAPLYIGEMTRQGEIFNTTNNYTWHVAMLDAKFTSWPQDLTGTNGTSFRVNTSGDAAGQSDFGTLDIAVKYFGPGSVATTNFAKQIRVQAFKSPDCTGIPVGECYVFDVDTLTNVNEIAVNATMRAIPPGSFYVCAFIDTNGDGRRDPWESWGYYNYIGSEHLQVYDPRYVVIDRDKNSRPFCRVFIEDTDLDRDGFPDIWEMEKYDSLTNQVAASGDTFFTTVNTNLVNKLEAFTSGATTTDFMRWLLKGASSQNSGEYNQLAELIIGAPPVFSSPAPTVEPSVSILSASSSAATLAFNADSAAASAAATVNEVISSGMFDLTSSAKTSWTWRLLFTSSLEEGSWFEVANGVYNAVNGAETVETAPDASKVDPQKGFFKVEME